MNRAELKQKDSGSEVLNKTLSAFEHSVECAMNSQIIDIHLLSPANQGISIKLDNLLK